ncbi:ABC transporter ATP-binding protein [Spiroplasma endosymbiont of Nebria brevicollis]|uniref:ABC transporter ATP-binding protein n=1 Tax=Spiroplasma endosymbiont of Nebria brevicollis TaxID=3066284 RepID=UPI00313AE5CC
MSQSIKNEKLVTISNVSKKYGSKTTVKNFSLDIYPGERIALIGANGSGKSTISEIIGGIRKPTSGSVIKKNKVVIGIQFQDSRYPHGITVMDMIKYYLQTFNIEITKEQLNKMLSNYQILHLTNKMVQSLSGGQQQRLNILLSVIHQPDLVILDEVSTGLDIEVREEIFEFLQTNIVEKNVAMLLVSHNMSEIERFCTRVIFMNEGEIIEETTVQDIIKIHGCVEKYMHDQLWKYKKQQQVEIDSKKATIKNAQSLVTKTTMNKHTSLLELIAKYFIRGFFVPFFIFIYPILTLFLQGFAFEGVGQEALQKLVVGISVMQIISIGIFFVPQTIIEFKSSVLMKRIGATNIHPSLFVGVIITLGIIFSVLAFLWTLLWTGIFFGSKFGWVITSTPVQLWTSLPWIIINIC